MEARTGNEAGTAPPTARRAGAGTVAINSYCHHRYWLMLFRLQWLSRFLCCRWWCRAWVWCTPRLRCIRKGSMSSRRMLLCLACPGARALAWAPATLSTRSFKGCHAASEGQVHARPRRVPPDVARAPR